MTIAVVHPTHAHAFQPTLPDTIIIHVHTMYIHIGIAVGRGSTSYVESCRLMFMYIVICTSVYGQYM